MTIQMSLFTHRRKQVIDSETNSKKARILAFAFPNNCIYVYVHVNTLKFCDYVNLFSAKH